MNYIAVVLGHGRHALMGLAAFVISGHLPHVAGLRSLGHGPPAARPSMGWRSVQGSLEVPVIGDNADPLDGWQMPRRCCGQWFDGFHCPTCGHYAETPANVVLSDN